MIKRLAKISLHVVSVFIMLQMVLPFWQPVAARLMENHVSGFTVAICTASGITYIDPAHDGPKSPSDFTPEYHSPLVHLDASSLFEGTSAVNVDVFEARYVSLRHYIYSDAYSHTLSLKPYLATGPPVIV